VHVHDELAGEPLRPLVGHVRALGLGAAHAEDRPVDVVHRDERRGHAGGRLEEASAAHALVLRQLVAQLLDARLDLLLLRGLRRGRELVARDELGRDRRRKGRGFSR
jgi:hypothetical protein